MRVACYVHNEDGPNSHIFDALLDLDRTNKRILFTPQESSRYSSKDKDGGDGEQQQEDSSVLKQPCLQS